MLENLNIKNSEEKTETVYEVTATFTFTDKDLQNVETKAFYEMIKPVEVIEDESLENEDKVEEYPTTY